MEFRESKIRAKLLRLALVPALLLGLIGPGIGIALAGEPADEKIVVAANGKAVLPERRNHVERPRLATGRGRLGRGVSKRDVVRLDRGRSGVQGAGAVGRPDAELERSSVDSLSKPSASARRVPGVERRASPDRGDGEEDSRRNRRKRKKSKGMPPWVAVRSLTPPSVETEELFRESQKIEPELPWFVVEKRGIEYENPPPYVQYNPPPLFYNEPPESTRYERAIKTILRKKVYSELRREAKKTWREIYRSKPRMAYADFEQGLFRINKLGREKGEYDPFHDDYYTSELKEDLFAESYRDGESDIPLVAWGPFVVTDTGSMRVDFGRVLEFEDYVGEPEHVDIEPGVEPKKVFLQSESYRVHTNVRLHFDPLGPVDEGGDPSWIVKRYGVAVTIDWLSDVLGKEMLSTEVEAEIDRDGDYGVAINFVIRSRD